MTQILILPRLCRTPSRSIGMQLFPVFRPPRGGPIRKNTPKSPQFQAFFDNRWGIVKCNCPPPGNLHPLKWLVLVKSWYIMINPLIFLVSGSQTWCDLAYLARWLRWKNLEFSKSMAADGEAQHQSAHKKSSPYRTYRTAWFEVDIFRHTGNHSYH